MRDHLLLRQLSNKTKKSREGRKNLTKSQVLNNLSCTLLEPLLASKNAYRNIYQLPWSSAAIQGKFEQSLYIYIT
jgi:hypothetical protein